MMRRYYLVRINEDNKDVYASYRSVAEACYNANPNPNDEVEYAIVYAPDLGIARLKRPKHWRPYNNG